MSFLPYLFLIILETCWSILPPKFKISLSNVEIFEIGSDFEEFPGNDYEMIKGNELIKFGLENDTKFYHRLHNHVKRYNKNLTKINSTDKNMIPRKTFSELNFDLSDPEPYEIVYWKNSKILSSRNISLNTNESRNISSNTNESENVSSANNETENYNYDYEALKKEYEDQLLAEFNSNELYNYTEIKETESVGDAIKTMVDFKIKNLNCTKEEMTGIGYFALNCIFAELETATGDDRWKLFNQLFRIAFIWTAIVLGIMLLLWLQKGWCCCCFKCKFCYPRKELDECKKFLADNPPGVYRSEKYNTIYYFEPNIYEIYAYKKLQNKIMTL